MPVELDRELVRGHGSHALHDRRLGAPIEHELRHSRARVEEDAARVTAIEMDENMLDADARELVLQLGELVSCRVTPASETRVGEGMRFAHALGAHLVGSKS